MGRATPRVFVALFFCAFAASASAQDLQVDVPMSDGVTLATDIFVPSAPGPFPVVLYRTPYDKNALATNARQIADRAPVVVVTQDTRGRFASTGIDCIFRCEVEGSLRDGQETLAWIVAQDWSNGVVVTDGGSALGIVQYAQATRTPSGLRAMNVSVATPSHYDHIFFPGGVFRQALAEGWLEGQDSSFFLEEVRAHPLRDAFWEPVQTEDRFAQVDVPALHIGGWYDIFSQGTIDAFVGYQHRGGPGATGRQKLVMGPWTHGRVGRGGPQGELTYPANAAAPPSPGDLWTTWMAHYLEIAPNPDAIAAMPAVQYYVMGDANDPGAPGNEWRSADDWPIPAAPTRWYMHADGELAERCPTGPETSQYRYDPADPSPTVGGGNLLLPAGPMDQAMVELRDDRLVFETPALDAPLEITGRVRAHLFVSLDAPDSDLMVRMMDVYPDGRSMLVLDGAARIALRDGPETLSLLPVGEIGAVDVDLWSTSIILAEGHRLRVTVSSANAPRFRPNPNDGTSYGEPHMPIVAQVSLRHDGDTSSYLELPVPGRPASDYVTCDGTVPSADGGADADAGALRDASTSPDDAGGGCACDAAGRIQPLGASALLLGLLGTMLVARRQRS